MDITETGRLLAVVQVGDNRRVDELTVQEWWHAVGDLRVEDAVVAVREHRRTSSEYLTARHVREGVTRLRRARLDAATFPEPPVGIGDDPRAYLVWQRTTVAAIADGTYEPGPMPALESRPAVLRAAGVTPTERNHR